MRRTFLLLLCLCLSLACISGNIAAAAAPTAEKPAAKAEAGPKLPAPLKKLELADGDTLVFLGDSITHQCLYTQYVEDYFYTRTPKVRMRFHNSGVGGDRASDALIRFDRDVAAYKPKYVTILLGMNDGSYKPYDDATFQTYRKDMTQLIEKIQSIGATPILMTPTMFDARAKRINLAKPSKLPAPPADNTELYNSTLAYYGAWLREKSVEGGFGFVDMYGPLNHYTLEARKTDPNFTLIRDAVHPDAPGQVSMAYSLLSDLGVSKSVSIVNISRGPDGQAIAKPNGGTVSDARYTSDGLEFTFTANSLPLVFPEDALPGVKMMNLGHKLSREALELHDLPPGKYQLLIDGTPVGTHESTVLERFVEIQHNPKTPQYQQAAAIAELNKQRTAEAVHPLRDLWREKKIQRRTNDQLAAAPNNEKLKQAAADLEKKLANFDEQIATLEAKAKAIEDRIYQQNPPLPRQYQLVRIAEGK